VLEAVDDAADDIEEFECDDGEPTAATLLPRRDVVDDDRKGSDGFVGPPGGGV
jgi:hypothetical protein